MKGTGNDDNNPAFVLYNRYIKYYRKTFGVKGTTMNTDLDKIGAQLFGKKWVGVFAPDTIPNTRKKEAYGIINTKPITEAGEHWIALYKGGGKVFIYDSYGRESKKVLPTLVKKLHALGVKYVDSDTLDKEQTTSQRNCGIRCLGFLSVVRDLGIKEAIKI